ncbi:hypothetical protein UCRPC4_g03789 [Phaeomoniella chlamydospora]|uniref:Uncharacterized protein n=1 Tax=Phaeomoniella chlamydospora TaxID=158046 RepID=A0A0G2EES0_PHACM|nr:hypothetical protein UCRPC4_g03789 [Phaeomoniella chlamydospora]
MKTFAILATSLTLLTSLATAAPRTGPVAKNRRSVPEVGITFIAAPVSNTYYFPVDNQVFDVEDTLSVNQIATSGGATCTFWGVDGSTTTVGSGAETVDVGPPQVQKSGICW